MKDARTYISFDILRRILQNYFEFSACTIMNANNWDNSILKRCKKRNVKNYFDLARKCERDFHEEMDRLGVLQPTHVTRVTDWIEQSIETVQGMIDQGFAYENQGSVFFDLHAYENQPDLQSCHQIMTPEIRKAASLHAKNVTKDDAVSQKRSRSDFAVWCPSKKGEPEWPSPWGPGRPRWHLPLVPTSVLSNAVVQKLVGTNQATFYSGDLVSKSDDQLSAKYWIRAGALNKWKGSVQGALKNYTPRHLRLLCLLHKYNMPIERHQELMQPVFALDKILSQFYEAVKTKQKRQAGQAAISPHNPVLSPATSQLQVLLQESRDKLDDALKDDFDTPAAMKILVALINETRLLLAKDDEETIPVVLIADIARYVTRILQIFGVIPDIYVDGAMIAYESGIGLAREEVLKPVLDAVTEFISELYDDDRHEKDICDAAHSLSTNLSRLGVEFEEISDRSEDDDVKYLWRLVD
jgi:cysteinyl-tRNA synthetase